MIFDSAPVQDLLYGLALVLSILGAIGDWRYRRDGGKQPGKREKILFLCAVMLVVALFAILAVLGANAEMIRYLVPPIAIILFATWELGRWRVRRSNPLEDSEQPWPY
jgi:drug/metabolite transporter (DMT)-like permease